MAIKFSLQRKRTAVKGLSCPNSECAFFGNRDAANIGLHEFYRSKAGKRRRYRCLTCGKTFCSTKSTPYYRLHHRRAAFDDVVSLSVEGVNKSAISRVKKICWNTVHRWLEKAATCCRRFNDHKTSGLEIPELQADELRTFIGGKEKPAWIFTAIDVWLRLWPSTIVGRRSYRNTFALFRDISRRMKSKCMPLIVTDGFELYEKVARQVFGPTSLYGQVLKTRRNDRIIKVERRAVIGAAWRFEEALLESEDSSTLNTSFVERLNLTIRQASAYLTRRTTCHARCMEQLKNQLEMVRCHYNFLRLSQSAQVRKRDTDAGHASWAGASTTFLPRDLHFAADSFIIEENRVYPGRGPLGQSSVDSHN